MTPLKERPPLTATTSTDSIANNVTGTTFAAKARAAELNAARANKALIAENPLPAPTEPLKLRPRNRGAVRVWKTLDLSAISDPPSNDLRETHSSSSGHTEVRLENLAYPDEQPTSLQVPAPRSIPAQANFSFLRETDLPHKEMSPASQNLANMMAGYDSAEWDPDMYRHSALADRAPSRVSRLEAFVPSRAPSAISSAAEYEATISDSYKSNLDILRARQQLQETAFVPASPISVDSTEWAQRQNSVIQLKTQPNEDPFIKYDVGYHHPRELQAQIHDTCNVPRLMRQPIHRFPAVKGTMNQSFRFPSEHAPMFDQTNDTHPRAVHPPPGLIHPTQIGRRAFLEPTSGRISTDDRYESLRQSLEKLGDAGTSTRTVLHDPMAHASGNQSAVLTADGEKRFNSDGASVVSRLSRQHSIHGPSELVSSSEAMPWRDRPANVYFSKAEEHGLHPGHPSTAERNVTSAEAWFSRDARVSSEGKNAIDHWLVDQRYKRRLRPDLYPAYDESGLAERRLSKDSVNEIGNVDGGRNTEVTEDHVSPNAASNHHLPNSTASSAPNLAGVQEFLLDTISNMSTSLDASERGYFAKYGRVAEWCVDQGTIGHMTYLGEDWGAPPRRVGRDPRYRPLTHEGRFTVFQDEAGVRVGGVGGGVVGGVGGGWGAGGWRADRSLLAAAANSHGRGLDGYGGHRGMGNTASAGERGGGVNGGGGAGDGPNGIATTGAMNADYPPPTAIGCEVKAFKDARTQGSMTLPSWYGIAAPRVKTLTGF
ncbi:hypothetical protein MMC25_002960 [Agyrium rufum]|nr:hypothetical protein [Agyrium rufum]